MALYAGVDGGGSKTHLLLLDTNTMASVALQGGASRTSSVGWQASQDVILGLLEEAVSALGADAAMLRGLSVCLSGIDVPEQSVRMSEEMQAHLQGADVEVVNDAMAVLSAGTEGAPGIVLVAGTGSICMGENAQGKVARAGGYGSFLGDEGSAYDIGRQGLLAAIQYSEGRGRYTALWDRVQALFGVRHPNELIPVVYGGGYPIGTIAAFAPVVIDSAEVDPVSSEIVVQAIHSYSTMIESVQHQLQADYGDLVVLAGGLMVRYTSMSRRLHEACPNLQIQTLQHRPIIGALLRSLKLSSQAVALELTQSRGWNDRLRQFEAQFDSDNKEG